MNMKIKVISNKDIAKLTYPLKFIVPPSSQAKDILGLISTFTTDRNMKLLFKLIRNLSLGYEKPISDYLNNKLDPYLKEILDELYIDVKTFDEKELEEKIREAFEKHRKLIEDIFLIKEYPKEFTFIVYQADFTGTFEGFENPIVLIVTKKFDEIQILRSFLVWYLTKIWKLDIGFAESVLEYVVRANYRYKLGLINEEQRKHIIESFANYRYWLFETFGEWPRKLYFLKNYDFSKNVWSWMLEKTKDKVVKEVCKRVLEQDCIKKLVI